MPEHEDDIGQEAELRALQAVISALSDLDSDARARIVDTASTFLQIGDRTRPRTPTPFGVQDRPAESAIEDEAPSDAVMSPKEYLLHKQPRTDVERIAVLAYYLTHSMDTPHFKTLDLSKLNTEAAQPKFSNAANSANNAVKRGYLVSSTKGRRQLSAAGEKFVEALPDREAARTAMAAAQPRRRPRRKVSTQKKSSQVAGNAE